VTDLPCGCRVSVPGYGDRLCPFHDGYREGVEAAAKVAARAEVTIAGTGKARGHERRVVARNIESMILNLLDRRVSDGLAVPRIYDTALREPDDPGMTRRDHYAGQALIALFAQAAGGQGIGESDYEYVAVHAFKLADAMVGAAENDDRRTT